MAFIAWMVHRTWSIRIWAARMSALISRRRRRSIGIIWCAPALISREMDDPHSPQIGQIADALRYLHSQRLIHGNVRGSNILIDLKGDAVLRDFGLFDLTKPDSPSE